MHTIGTADINHIHELVYELRVSQIMNPAVVSVSPDITMKVFMETLRANRISGAPVVADGKVVGIVSIEDLIKALASQLFDDPVERHMTREVVTVGADDHVVQAVKLFARHGYGRLPVMDKAGALVGIVTGSDITKGLLMAMDRQFKSEEIRRYRASHIFEDITSDLTRLVLHFQVPAGDFDQGGRASSTLKRTLQRLGVAPALLRRINVSSYEAEMNLIIHTTAGGEIRVEITPREIILITQDSGPGIPDVEEAFRPGFSTAADWVRELGFGAGMGLCNIKRSSDRVSMVSEPGKGTLLRAVFEVQPGEGDGEGPL
jgi:CBS domain-containing protein/anti-sigma regulatory factor (Ser/Thr protein kinase)